MCLLQFNSSVFPIEGWSAATESLLLRQTSWLLRAAAIELRLTAAHSQRSHVQRLINLLLDDSPEAQSKGIIHLFKYFHLIISFLIMAFNGVHLLSSFTIRWHF